MGTRNLTIIIDNKGKTKVAQYCQWDGYPSGQGKTILEFLRKKFDRRAFNEKLKSCRFISDKEFDKLWESTTGTKNADMVPYDVATQFGKVYPQLHRDLGGKVLEFIQKSKGEVLLQDSGSFQKDGLFCEWVYKIDLSKNTFEVFAGGDHLAASYSLTPRLLPTLQEFYADLNSN